MKTISSPLVTVPNKLSINYIHEEAITQWLQRAKSRQELKKQGFDLLNNVYATGKLVIDEGILIPLNFGSFLHFH